MSRSLLSMYKVRPDESLKVRIVFYFLNLTAERFEVGKKFSEVTGNIRPTYYLPSEIASHRSDAGLGIGWF